MVFLIRAFIACEISDEVRKGLSDIQEKLKKGVQFTRANPSWVKVDSMHLTLKFLGEIPETRIDEIEGAMKQAAEEAAAFEIGVKGLGVFPHEHNPKVLWIGVKRGRQKIEELQSRLDDALEHIGFEKERRPFHPHFTLARIKSPRGSRQLMDIMKSHSGEDAGTCGIDRLILFKSQLHPKGAIYTRLKEVIFPTQ